MKNPIVHGLAIATMLSLLLAVACKKGGDKNTTPTRVGCMDNNATNYDAQANAAGICHYEIEALTGSYAVVDSYFYLKQTGPTSFVPDTIVHQDTIVVSVVAHDSLSFSKLITNSSATPTHFMVNKTDGTFSYYYATSNINTTATGTLANNKLEYATRTTYYPLTSGNNSRRIHGIKMN